VSRTSPAGKLTTASVRGTAPRLFAKDERDVYQSPTLFCLVCLIKTMPDRLTRAAGNRLTFTSRQAGDGKPFYHFALTSPENRSRPPWR